DTAGSAGAAGRKRVFCLPIHAAANHGIRQRGSRRFQGEAQYVCPDCGAVMRACRWLPCCLALVAGGAEIPPAPVPPPDVAKATPTDAAIASAIAAHRQKAERYAAAGDLYAAAREWHILTLLAPGDAQYEARDEATRAALAQTVREQGQSDTAGVRDGA